MIFFYISLSTFICYQVLKYRQEISILNETKTLKQYSKKIIKNKKELFLTPELLAIILIIIVSI